MKICKNANGKMIADNTSKQCFVIKTGDGTCDNKPSQICTLQHAKGIRNVKHYINSKGGVIRHFLHLNILNYFPVMQIAAPKRY